MNRYILIPEDTVRVLPPEDGADAATRFASRRPTGCWSAGRWCSFPRTGPITWRFWKRSGHTRRNRLIFPKRPIISRNPATTTDIITDKNEKSRTS